MSDLLAIETQNLSKRYASATAVDSLNLQIRQGEIFGFLGPNGAGKSTTINMLCGLLAPSSGQVFIFGKPIGGRIEQRTRLGICPQNLILWNKLTCLEQLQFIGELYSLPRKLSHQRACQLLDAMGLTNQRHQIAARLSGGMQRRLNLIMALVHDPEIVILDEPEAGLDPQSRILVREYIKSLAGSKTVILTTHNMDEADRVADRVAIIDHGRLLRLDTPQFLKDSIGEGDILEIDLENSHGQAINRAAALFNNLSLPVKALGSSLFFQTQRIMEHLPQISSTLQQAGFNAKEMRLHPNTLEDVFIHLTGRSLRT
jgi:ABC-2 type transport system ATP-binding protein